MLLRLARLMGMKDLEGRDPDEVRMLFFLLVMYIFLSADFFLMNPSQKPIMDEFGVDEAAVGLVSTIFVFVGALIALPWGYLADRGARKGLVALTIIIGEIPCLLTGYVRSYNELLLVRSLTGIGIGGIMPLIYSIMGDLVSERERSTASAWLGLAEGIGLGGGMILAGFLAESDVKLLGTTGWRLPFVLVALPNFFVVPLFWFFSKEPMRGGGEDSIKTALQKGKEYTRKIQLSDYWAILKRKTNIHFFLQSIPGTVGWGVLPAWMITFYHVTKEVSIATATMINTIVGVGMIAGGFIGGIWGNSLHKKDKRYLPMFCGITTLAGVVFFYILFHYPIPEAPSMRDFIGPLVVGVIGGAFITMTGSNVRAIVMNVNPPENRGAMMSLFSLTDSIGKGIGPYLGGFLIKFMGGALLFPMLFAGNYDARKLEVASYVITMDIATFCWIPCALVFLFLMTPQYPKDAEALEKLMEQRAKEMENLVDLRS